MCSFYTQQTHIASDSEIAHISVDEMYILQKDPHVGDVRFHQEFGKRLGNGNINLQRCKQFPPWTMRCPRQRPTPPSETKLVFRIIAITFLGPFQSTWGPFFRSYSPPSLHRSLSPYHFSPAAWWTMVVNRWRVRCILHYSTLPPRIRTQHSVYSIRRRWQRRKGVRITPKGNIEGFPTITYTVTRAKPSGKRNELVFSAVSQLHDTLYIHTHAYTHILLYTYPHI